MSYNSGTIDIVSSEGFCIPRTKWDALVRKFADEAPESSCLSEDWVRDSTEEHRGMLFVNRIRWQGEGSGHSWDIFVKDVLPAFLGTADLVVTWERGDSHSGLRLLNGKVTEHELTMALGEEKI